METLHEVALVWQHLRNLRASDIEIRDGQVFRRSDGKRMFKNVLFVLRPCKTSACWQMWALGEVPFDNDLFEWESMSPDYILEEFLL